MSKRVRSLLVTVDGPLDIQEHVPIPPRRNTHSDNDFVFQALVALKVGQSIFVPIKRDASTSEIKDVQRWLGAKSRAKLNTGKKFTMRSMIESGVTGIRVWRME